MVFLARVLLAIAVMVKEKIIIIVPMKQKMISKMKTMMMMILVMMKMMTTMMMMITMMKIMMIMMMMMVVRLLNALLCKAIAKPALVATNTFSCHDEDAHDHDDASNAQFQPELIGQPLLEKGKVTRCCSLNLITFQEQSSGERVGKRR